MGLQNKAKQNMKNYKLVLWDLYRTEKKSHKPCHIIKVFENFRYIWVKNQKKNNYYNLSYINTN